jgi:hypothetical protein
MAFRVTTLHFGKSMQRQLAAAHASAVWVSYGRALTMPDLLE